MKLRFHGNQLRVRLSRSEVARLAKGEHLNDAVEFVNDQRLSYEIESMDREDFSARFENGEIRIMLPGAAVKRWAESDQTGIEGVCGTLAILIEKDFKCLHRDSEQNADSFPNPLADIL